MGIYIIFGATDIYKDMITDVKNNHLKNIEVLILKRIFLLHVYSLFIYIKKNI